MLDQYWKQFKSGTDVRAVAMDGVADEPMTLTDEVVGRIAGAFVCWLSKKSRIAVSDLTVALGRDSRLSGPRIRDTAATAMAAGGVTVLDCGLASTPAMFMTTVDLGCDGAVQITASHHPWHRNGLKFFLPTGGVESEDITEILELAQKGILPEKAEGQVVPTDYMRQYAARLRDQIVRETGGGEHPLEGLRIAVDAGNGAGGFYASEVLEPLGADVSGSQFLDPDGRFPNHIPNPENPDAMASVCEAVLRVKADLGVIFDTDVDRAGCVGPDGREINRNRLIALAAAIALEGNEGGYHRHRFHHLGWPEVFY